MTDTNIDEAIRKFKGYVRGENGFDELDFKEVIVNLIQEAYKRGYIDCGLDNYK